MSDFLWSHGYPGFADWVLDGLIHYLKYFGRLAAPIFVYGIAQGFVHTTNVRRYLSRILAAAVIAQVPYTLFDLAESRLYGLTGDWRETSLNILFTLAMALAVLAVHEELKRRGWVLLSPLAMILAAWAAKKLNMEGGQGYILMAYVYYLSRNRPRWQRALLYIPTVMLSRRGLIRWVLESLGTAELARALSNCLLNVLGNYFGMLVTLSSSGEKGKERWRYFLYGFYPAHFAVLALIGYLRPPLL